MNFAKFLRTIFLQNTFGGLFLDFELKRSAIVKTTHTVKDTLKAFDDFKNKQRDACSNVFWYVKVCIFWKCIQ